MQSKQNRGGPQKEGPRCRVLMMGELYKSKMTDFMESGGFDVGCRVRVRFANGMANCPRKVVLVAEPGSQEHWPTSQMADWHSRSGCDEPFLMTA